MRDSREGKGLRCGRLGWDREPVLENAGLLGMMVGCRGR